MSNISEMDQALARRLLIEGATLVFLDVPPGTEFGIDMKSWNTGDNFKGVKMIPPGLHYVYYSAVNKEGDSAPRVGFVHNFKKLEMVVMKWDHASEDISTEVISEEEVSRIKANLLNLDRYLGPYPFDVWKRWRKLVTKADDELVTKLVPQSGYIRAALELVSKEFTSGDGAPAAKQRRYRLSTAEEKEEDLLPQLKPIPGTEIRFTALPERNFPEDATPAEITQHSLDHSYTLDLIVVDVVGEMQFAFVSFLVGHSLEAFEHWKKLVILLCSCDDALSKRREVYDVFLTALEVQILEIPQDFLVDIVASNNFVYHSLRVLFRNIQMNDLVDDRLKTKAKRLQDRLTHKFQWDFSHLDEEDEDEAPVIVDV
ncbi:hypothetical protein L9F63_005964 [Diploptera punctata]|uniref:Protein AAR2 homolog n=1 Tax=Diploptera punctata TaxID=6984 RepID=A0AAD7ZCI1_DIPPU|nr:hypothetical protein L9F63_005964 [Diploptera punctata]